MLGIILIYFIGKAYYDLAVIHNKNKWGFAILGIVAYYAGTVIAGIVLGLLIEFGIMEPIDSYPDIIINLLALPVGLLATWGTYKILQSQWEKVPKDEKTEILDQDLIQ